MNVRNRYPCNLTTTAAPRRRRKKKRRKKNNNFFQGHCLRSLVARKEVLLGGGITIPSRFSSVSSCAEEASEGPEKAFGGHSNFVGFRGHCRHVCAGGFLGGGVCNHPRSGRRRQRTESP